VGDIKTGPVDSFHDTAIGLLFDKPGCVFLGIDQGTQTCDDVWIPNGAIILKGLWVTCSSFYLLMTPFWAPVEKLRLKCRSSI
jgi:hypothetical protein